MEMIPILFALGLVALGGLALVLGVVAYARVKSLERSVRELRSQIADLRAQAKSSPEPTSLRPTKPAQTEPVRAAPAGEPPTSTAAGAPMPRSLFEPPAAKGPASAPWSASPPAASPRETTAPLETPAASRPPSEPVPLATPLHVAPSSETPLHAAPAATPPPITPRPATEPVPPAAGVDLERWLGVRGAAVLGGIVVAIAGFLLLQYSIEHQMITPQTRVILGAVAGIAFFAVSFPLRKRGYDIVASSVTGAGAVLLYASAWAAHVLYGMIGFPAAFAAMIAVTAACGWLAQRHASQVIAVLGLVGGFATPLALSSGADRPFSLFGYVLLLDFAFLFVARSRRWPSIGLLALLGTFVIQALWIGTHMTHERLGLALVLLGLFALVFALFAAQVAGPERRRWVASQVGALLVPFVFAAWFAQDRDMGPNVWPMACLAGVLAIAAGWIAQRGDMPWLPFGSATGSVALVLTWAVSRDFRLGVSGAQELLYCCVGLAILHLVIAELAARRPSSDEVRRGARNATLAAAFGFQLVAFGAWTGPHASGPWPWVGMTMAMALIVLRLVAIGAPPATGVASAALAGLTALLWSAGQVMGEPIPPTLVWCGALVSFGGSALLAVWLQRHRVPAWTFWAVAAFGLPAMFATDAFDNSADAAIGVPLAAVLVLGVQIAFAATAARSSALFACAAAGAWMAGNASGFGEIDSIRAQNFEPLMTLALIHLVVFTLWPIVRPAYWTGRANAWRAAALVPLLWFPVVRGLYAEHWPNAPIFVVPLAFEALSVFAALCLWCLRQAEDRAQRSGRIWFACVAILFAAMLVPLQVGRDEAAVTLALFGFGVALLRRRVEARALAWVAAVALAVSTFVLVLLRPWESFPHSDVRVWNVLAYVYLLPAGAAILAARNLRLAAGGVVTAGVAGICGVLLVFAWINLEIANAYSKLPDFTWRFERDPARGLTASIAWAIYALVLLGLGVGRGRSALRWASLVLLMLTIGKVFLFDLGHLEGLYRAASVFGLGMSLLLVSVLYQRFVFRRPVAA